MSKRSYFSLYQSPNIVIVPTISFSGNTANKKKKLDTGNNDAGQTSKLAITSDIVKTSYEQFKGSTIIKNTNKTETNRNSNLPSKPVIISTKQIKLNRLKPISPCMRNLSNLVDLNRKSNTSLVRKVINKQSDPGARTDIKPIIAHPTPISKSDFNCKVNKKTAEEKNKQQLVNKKSKPIKINEKNKNNTDSAISKNNENINIKPSSKLKTLKNIDAYKNKVTLDSSHCDIKIDSKHTQRAEHKSSNTIKRGNIDAKPRIKKVDKSKQAEQILQKKSDSKNSPILDKGSGNNTEVKCECETKNKKSIQNDVTDHNTKIYKRTNEKCVLNTNSKKTCKRKSFVNQTVPKDNTKDKHKISSKQSQSDDKCKLKKVGSKNNLKHDSNKLKLKLLKKVNKTKKSSHNGSHQKNSPKKVTLDNIKNDDTYGATTKRNSIKLNNVHKGKQIKLIFNLVISHSSTKTSNTVVNNTSPDSSSDVSFLDDINIDEIVESLKQLQDTTDATNQEIGKNIEPEPNINNLLINNAPNEHDRPNKGFNNNTKGDSKLSAIKLEDDFRNDENARKSDEKLLHDRTPISVTKSTTLLEENKKADNIVDQHKKTMEDFNDFSSGIPEALSHSNIEDISATKTKVKKIKSIETTEGNTYQNSKTDKSLPDQSKEIHVSNDPIEKQLFKLFEMNTNSSGAQCNNSVDNCTVINTINTDNVDNTTKTEKMTEQSNQFLPCDLQNNCSEPQVNAEKDNCQLSSQCLKKEIKSAVITPMAIKQKKNTESQKYTTVNENLCNQTKLNQKCMKSEVIKVTKKQKLVTLEDDNFIKSLEERMFDFLDERYTVKTLIHVGKFSKIYQCKDSSGSDYAIKILRNIRDRLFLGAKKENMLMNIQQEIPKEKLYCIQLINGFSMCGHWCFLMEYYPRNLGQALQEQNKSFFIDRVQILAKQLIMAVIVLRNNNIVHSDIRPSHILINNTNDRLKLCGFDNSYYIEDAILDPYMGHQNYRAPEVMLGHSSGFSLDVWSTALVMYEMATNSVLFPSFDNNDTLFKQMCTLGGIPHTMVAHSIFKDDHFYENSFMRRTGYKKSTIKFIKHFYRSKRIPKTIFGAYERDWMKSRTEQQQDEDMEKLGSFLSLLEQMLVIYPRYRLTIEFVYANAFIYE